MASNAGRRCCKCGLDKPAEQFSNTLSGGLRSWCKPCMAEASRQWYRDNADQARTRSREKQRRYIAKPANRKRHLALQARYRDEVRRIVAEARTAPCSDCGIAWPPYVMDFHHRNPAEKVCEVGNAKTPARALRELAKCDTICANCHRIRHHIAATTPAQGRLDMG